MLAVMNTFSIARLFDLGGESFVEFMLDAMPSAAQVMVHLVWESLTAEEAVHFAVSLAELGREEEANDVLKGIEAAVLGCAGRVQQAASRAFNGSSNRPMADVGLA